MCDLFENILKCQCKDNFVIILVSFHKNVYKVFLKIFVVLKVMCEKKLFVRKVVSKQLKVSYPLKSFLLFSFFFRDSAIDTINW